MAKSNILYVKVKWHWYDNHRINPKLQFHFSVLWVQSSFKWVKGESVKSDGDKTSEMLWATPIKIHAPPVEDVEKVYHRGSVNFQIHLPL